MKLLQDSIRESGAVKEAETTTAEEALQGQGQQERLVPKKRLIFGLVSGDEEHSTADLPGGILARHYVAAGRLNGRSSATRSFSLSLSTLSFPAIAKAGLGGSGDHGLWSFHPFQLYALYQNMPRFS